MRPKDISVGDVFSFVVPALQFVQFQSVGLLLASDLLLLAALPIALLRHPERLRQRSIPTILTLGVVWLVAQVVTDIVRNSPPDDFLRGWTKIVLLLVNFTVLWIVVCRNRRRFVLYTIGLGLGTIMAVYLHPSDEALISPWKFGVGGTVTLLAIVWAAHSVKHRYLGILLPLTAFAIADCYADCRSLALITFITAIYSLFQMAHASNQRQFGRGRLVALAVMVAFGIWGFTFVYSHFVERGVFGEYAQRKLQVQENGAGGLLLGGRSEVLASGQAIIDSPILGHGSWARDPTYAAILADKRAELGYKNLSGQGGKTDDLIPSHSYVFGGWVEAGVAGAVFWIFVFVYTIRTLLRVSGSEPLLPLFAFAGFQLMWDILFSPLGTPTRFVAPYFVVAVFVLASFRDAQPAVAEEA